MSCALTAYPTTDLHDAHPDARFCALRFVDYGGRVMFAGRIRTVVTAEDSKLAQELFRSPGDGAVAVVDGGGSLRRALLGDIYAGVLADNGWAGVVICGAVRDAARLASIDLGIKALAATPARSAKAGIGAVDVPVAFGGVLFAPGECVYCDADGVLVSASPLAPTPSPP